MAGRSRSSLIVRIVLSMSAALLLVPTTALAHHEEGGSYHAFPEDGRLPGLGDFKRVGKTTYRYLPAREEYAVRRPGQPTAFVHGDTAPVPSRYEDFSAAELNAVSEKDFEKAVAEEGDSGEEGGGSPSHELAPICHTSGRRIVPVFTHRPGSKAAMPVEAIRDTIRFMNWKVADRSSQMSGGKRVVQLPVDCDEEGEISVYEVTTESGTLSSISQTVPGQLFGRPSGEQAVKYMVFDTESSHKMGNVLGIAEFRNDSGKDEGNSSATTSSVAISYGYGNGEDAQVLAVTPLHELLHTLGAVQGSAGGGPLPPYSNNTAHCIDGLDIMCYVDGGGEYEGQKYSDDRCLASEGYDNEFNDPIDCGGDTYFNAAPEAGTWLGEYWDLAGPEDPFLIAAPSAIKTEPASAVGSASAVLHGTFDPEGYNVGYRFEIGTTEAYGSSVPAAGGTVEFGPSPIEVQEPAADLEPQTTYHYRLVAENDVDTVYGEDETFTTGAVQPPAASTEKATDVGIDEATLHASIAAHDASAEYHFEYGTSTSYGTSVPVPPKELVGGDDAAEVAEAIGSLAVDATYHFRIVASNSVDTAYGEDQTFKTAPRACDGDCEWLPEEGTVHLEPPSYTLADVSCASGTRCMAIGYGNETETSFAASWNGSGWTTAPWEDATQMAGISCVGNACMAVGAGDAATASSSRFLTEEEVESIPLAVPGGAKSIAMHDVSCVSESSCVAVGSYEAEDGKQKTLAESFDGETWSIHETPQPSTNSAQALLSVSCASASFCVAVGKAKSKPFAASWNGEKWSTSEAAGAEGGLKGVSCHTASFCMAVGDTLEGQTIAERWEGAGWSLVKTETAEKELFLLSEAHLTALDCTAANSCKAVGVYLLIGHSEERMLTASWNGSAWTFTGLSNPSGRNYGALAGISCTAENQCTAVGTASTDEEQSETLPLAERWNGSKWSLETGIHPIVASRNGLADVSCSSAASCMAVGHDAYREANYAESWNGSKWTMVRENLGDAGGAVSCIPLSTCVTLGSSAGASGTWIFYQPGDNTSGTTNFKAFVSPAGAKALDLRDVSCTTKSSCTAVGSYEDEGGEQRTLAEAYDGEAWSIQETPEPGGDSSEALRGVSCASASFCAAVGEAKGEPFIASWDGEEWSASEAATAEGGLKGVSCHTASFCMAVGEREGGKTLAERWDGKGWSTLETETAEEEAPGLLQADLTAVSCTAAASCSAVGNYLTESEEPMLSAGWNGSAWIFKGLNNPSGQKYGALAAVSCTAEDQCTAVGTVSPDESRAETSPVAERYKRQAGESSPPEAITGPAIKVGTTGATLTGVANPEGSKTSYYFEYGKSDAYGTKVTTSPVSEGSDSSNVALYKQIEGLSPGTTYHYRLVAQGPAATTHGGDKTFVTVKSTPPKAATGAATDIQASSATLTGTVNPEGTPTTYYFEYGSSKSYGSKSPILAKTAGYRPSDVAVSSTPAGFTHGATYHYRLVAKSSAGTAYGEDKEFTTLNTPVVVTEEAADVKLLSATLHATVNPRGRDTTYYFEYGDNKPYKLTYGSKVPILPVEIGSGTSAVAVSDQVGSLEASTTYHYRVVAENAEGITFGKDRSFMTASPSAASLVSHVEEAEPFDGSSSSLARFGEDWSALDWASGTTPKGQDTAAGWGPVDQYPTANGAYYEPTYAGTGCGEAITATMTALPVTTGHYISLWLNMPNPPEEKSGYQLKAIRESSGTYNLEISEWKNGVIVISLYSSKNTLSNGNRIALVRMGENLNNVERRTWFWPLVDAGSGFTLTKFGGLNFKDESPFEGGNAGIEASASSPRLSEVKIGSLGCGEATTEAASEVKATSAVINGTVNPNGFETTYYFEFGKTLAYGDKTSVKSAGNGTSDVSVSEPRSALQADTTYHYRLVSESELGTLYGEDEEFSTSGGGKAPKATTEVATDVGAEAATLNGTVNPEGSETSYWFEYDTTSYEGEATHGAKVPASPKSVGSGTADVGAKESIGGLKPGTVYHFRVVAEGASTVRGEDETFTSSPKAPKAITEAATSISASSATLNGTVNPEGSETSYYFEYDKSSYEGETAHGTKVPTSPKSAGSGTSNVAVSQELSGLEPGGIYYFRIVADKGGYVVRGEDKEFKTATDPRFDFSFGKAGSGEGQLKGAKGIAVDSSGNVWVADTENNRIEKFNSEGKYVFQLGKEGTGTNGEFKSLKGIAIDSSGNVWVVDSGNNRVQKFNSEGKFVLQLGKEGTGNGEFKSPTGIALDSVGRPFVADTGNNRIQKFNTKGEYLAKFGEEGVADGKLKAPQGVLIDPQGRIWVADTGNNRVQRFNGTSFAYISKFGKEGTGNGEFKSPTAIVSDFQEKLWVIDSANNRAQKFDIEGNYLDQLGEAGKGAGQMESPSAIATPAAQKVLVLDSGNARVQSWSVKAEPPVATTNAATNVGAASGTLKANINPQALKTTYFFEYGKSEALGSKTPEKELSAGLSNVIVEEPLSGLTPNQKYYFRVVAKSSAGTSPPASIKNFTTLKAPKATTEAATEVKASAAKLNGTVNPEGSETSYYFEYGETTSYGTKTTAKSAGSGTANVAEAEALSGLKAGTTYHFRIVAAKGSYTVPGDDKEFSTLKAPKATTEAASEVTATTAKLNGTVNPEGSSTSYYFEWGKTTSYGSKTSEVSAGSGTSAVTASASLNGLEASQAYHFRLVAKGATTVEGADKEFTALKKAPKATTEAATEVKATSAKLNGTVNPEGVATSYYFEYDTSEYKGEATHGTKIPASPKSAGSGASNVAVSESPSGLSANTTYHVRLVAESEAGKAYGEDKSFKTPGLPKVTTEAATEVHGEFATLNATVNPEGTSTSYWFEYGKNGVFALETTHQLAGSGTSSLAKSAQITSLEIDTPYQFRIVAENEVGTSYGDSEFFRTSKLPKAITVAATKVTNSSATLNATVNPEGSATSYWLQYAQEPYESCEQIPHGPLVPDEPVEIGSGTSNVSVSQALSDLSAGSVYHFRVWANNDAGVICGEEKSFTTLKAPIAATEAATEVKATSAKLKGTVNPEGSETSYYFEYDTSEYKGEATHGTKIPASPKSAGSGASNVAVSESPSGLSANTTYHVRLVAESEAGKTYGEDKSFTTNNAEFSFSFGAKGSGNGQFTSPRGVAVDSAGNIWVVDNQNNRVQKFNSKGEYVSQFGTQGETAGKFWEPTDIAIDSAGNLWVTDTENNRIEKFDSEGKYVSKAGTSTELREPTGIAIDSAGNIWVADSGYEGNQWSRITKFNSEGKFISYVGKEGSGNGQFKGPMGIVADSAGNIWAVDTGNNRVQKFNSKGEYVSQFGTEGTGNGQFKKPKGIAIDSAGNIWVTDTGNKRVQKFNSEGKYLSQFNTEGWAEGSLSLSIGLEIDSAGSIWIAETTNRVKKWVP
jgi:DNA-binding beta-propeller fold protein YncE